MKSILYAFVQHLVHLHLTDSVPALWEAFKGLLRAFFTPRTSQHEYITNCRNGHCRECLFYDKKWQTCGTPGEVQESIITDGVYFAPSKIGCWCYLPWANRDPKKDCWARAKGLDVGWPDALRPTEALHLTEENKIGR